MRARDCVARGETKNTDPSGSNVKQELNSALEIKVKLTPVVPWWRR